MYELKDKIKKVNKLHLYFLDIMVLKFIFKPLMRKVNNIPLSLTQKDYIL